MTVVQKAEKSYAILSKLPLHELFLMYHTPGNLSQTFIYSAAAFELSVVPNKKTKLNYFFSANCAFHFLSENEEDSILIVLCCHSVLQGWCQFFWQKTLRVHSVEFACFGHPCNSEMSCFFLTGEEVKVKLVICVFCFGFFLRIIESFSLQKSSRNTESSRKLSTAESTTKQCPQVPHLQVL